MAAPHGSLWLCKAAPCGSVWLHVYPDSGSDIARAVAISETFAAVLLIEQSQLDKASSADSAGHACPADQPGAAGEGPTGQRGTPPLGKAALWELKWVGHRDNKEHLKMASLWLELCAQGLLSGATVISTTAIHITCQVVVLSHLSSYRSIESSWLM